jgi:hypothetical protein
MENPLALITSFASGKNSNEFKGIDWVPTGRIDFATKLESNADPVTHLSVTPANCRPWKTAGGFMARRYQNALTTLR